MHLIQFIEQELNRRDRYPRRARDPAPSFHAAGDAENSATGRHRGSNSRCTSADHLRSSTRACRRQRGTPGSAVARASRESLLHRSIVMNRARRSAPSHHADPAPRAALHSCTAGTRLRRHQPTAGRFATGDVVQFTSGSGSPASSCSPPPPPVPPPPPGLPPPSEPLPPPVSPPSPAEHEEIRAIDSANAGQNEGRMRPSTLLCGRSCEAFPQVCNFQF